MKIFPNNTISCRPKPKLKTLNQSANFNLKINFSANKDLVSFGKKPNNKIVKKLGISLASILLALSLGTCASRNSGSILHDTYGESYLIGKNKVDGGLFSKKSISGSLNETNYNIEEAEIWGSDILHRTRRYTGEIGDCKTSYTIQQGIVFEDDIIQGDIGGELFELHAAPKSLDKRIITGTYKGKEISLELDRNLLSSDKIIGDNTELYIDYEFASANNFSVEGGFEYDRELLPAIFSYLKFEKDIENESSNNIN